MPKSFTDKAKRVWILTVNLTTLERVKDGTGISLMSIIDPDSAKTGLKIDGVDVFRILVALCQPEKIDLSIEAFKNNIDDPDVLEDASNALVDAVIDFLPQQRRLFMQSIALTAREMRPKVLAAATRNLDTIRQKMALELTESKKTLESYSSGNSEASQGLTPEATNSAN